MALHVMQHERYNSAARRKVAGCAGLLLHLTSPSKQCGCIGELRGAEPRAGRPHEAARAATVRARRTMCVLVDSK